MNLTALSIRRPVTIVMTFLSLGVIGVIATQRLPLEYWPSLEIPEIYIEVPYPGSTPAEVERLITKPIEESLATLADVREIESESNQDGASIEVEFDWGQNIDVKGVAIHDRIDAIRDELPDDVEQIFIGKFNTSDLPILRLNLASNQDLTTRYLLLDRTLKRRLARIDGVSRIELWGVQQPEVRIQLIPERLAAYGIGLNELSRQLAQSNFSLSAGRIETTSSAFRVRATAQFDSLETIAALPINNTIRLGDIATVSMTTPERDSGWRQDGRPAVGVGIYKEPGANIVAVSQTVKTELDAIMQLPAMDGIEVFVRDDQADGVTQSLSDVLESGLIGALLSLLVLYLFLRQWPTTLMVTLAVPFSLLITLAVMYFVGLSLNIMSMMGLMLAIGMLVDNAVVVTECIYRRRQVHLQNGEADGDGAAAKAQQAALLGTREVALAVTAGTLTTVIVFLPNLIGTQTDITIFLSHVAITVTVAMLASLLVAQTLIPMIAARIPVQEEKAGGTFSSHLRAAYEKVLDWSLQRRWLTSAFTLLILFSIAIPVSLVKQDMFPSENSRRMWLDYNLTGSYTLPQVEQAMDRIETYLLDNQEQLQIASFSSRFAQDWGGSFILLKQAEDMRPDEELRTVSDIKTEILKNLPLIAIGQPAFDEQRVGSSNSLEIYLYGDSSEVLAGLSQDVGRTLESVPGIARARSNNSSGEQQVRISVDRERAWQAGLSAQDVASAIAVAMRGRNLRPYRTADGELDLHLAFSAEDARTLEQLRALPLLTADGRQIRLDSIADFQLQDSPTKIEHINRKTSLSIAATLLPDASADTVKPLISQALDSLRLPPGYSWSFGEGFQQSDDTQSRMLINMLLAAVLIYILMAALFESVLHPAAILTSIIFSIVGVFWFFMITGTIFSFMAMIGILVLMGVVVNNGIVMIDHVNNLRGEGMSRHAALLRGAGDRLRPILMTASTTILGLLPLCIGSTSLGNTGAMYFPMARAIVGGLGFATIVSLLVLPTIYVLLDDLGHWGRDHWNQARRLRWLAPAQTSAAISPAKTPGSPRN